MRKPFNGIYPITQQWGLHPKSYARFGLNGHNGIDYGMPTGTTILSPHDGKVIEARYDKGGYGYYLKIEDYREGSILAHLKTNSFEVKVGDYVKEGQAVALSGNTGNSTGPHLHWGYYPRPRNRGNGYGGTINQLSLIGKSPEVQKVLIDPTKQLPQEYRDIDEFKEAKKLKLTPDKNTTYTLALDTDAFDTFTGRVVEVFRIQDTTIRELTKKLDARDRSIASLKKKLAKTEPYEPVEGTNVPTAVPAFPDWKKALIEARRIFVGASLVQLAIILPTIPNWLGEALREPKMLLSFLIIPVLTAGYKGITKYLQDKYGNGDYSKLIYKL